MTRMSNEALGLLIWGFAMVSYVLGAIVGATGNPLMGAGFGAAIAIGAFVIGKNL